jgi:TIR domain
MTKTKKKEKEKEKKGKKSPTKSFSSKSESRLAWNELPVEYREVLTNALVGLLLHPHENWDWFDDTMLEIPIDLSELGLVAGVEYEIGSDGSLSLSPGPVMLTPEGEEAARAEVQRRLGRTSFQTGYAFVSYVREDSGMIDSMCSHLASVGLVTWRDTERLLPGEEWKVAIRRAIGTGAAFVACFSSASETGEGTATREELVVAIEELRRRPLNPEWFIPVRLEPCEVPALSIGAGRTIRDLEIVDLYDRKANGLRQLVVAIDRLTPTIDKPGSP